MFQEEFTNTLNQLAHRGMSESIYYREKRNIKSGKLTNDVNVANKNHRSTVQLKLFEL